MCEITETEGGQNMWDPVGHCEGFDFFSQNFDCKSIAGFNKELLLFFFFDRWKEKQRYPLGSFSNNTTYNLTDVIKNKILDTF